MLDKKEILEEARQLCNYIHSSLKGVSPKKAEALLKEAKKSISVIFFNSK